MNKIIPSIKVPIIQKGIVSKVTLSDELKNKKIIMFGVPGAFTPTCSEKHMPSYIKLHNEFVTKGIDDIYCLSVNDSFVMNAWARHHDIGKVKVIPDGNGEFTRKMGMLVKKENLTFGMRSWRYAAIIDDCKVIESFIEEGYMDNANDDPYEKSSPQNILNYLKN